MRLNERHCRSDDGIASGEGTLVGINGEVYLLAINGGEVEAMRHELNEVEA